MTPNSYWKSVSEDRSLDLPIYGGMGKASSVALGLALAVPDRKILVLDGDGGLLMNLGSLVTIAEQQPRNLVHVVFEDGVYFTTGAQPVPGAGSMDLAGIARGRRHRRELPVQRPGGLRHGAPRPHGEVGPRLRLSEGQPRRRRSRLSSWRARATPCAASPMRSPAIEPGS